MPLVLNSDIVTLVMPGIMVMLVYCGLLALCGLFGYVGKGGWEIVDT